jgi:hypothetical protein
MRVSKRDFLKMLGIGSAVTTALARAGGDMTAPPKLDEPALTPSPEPRGMHVPSDWYDAIDDILYDRVVFPRGALLPTYLRFFSAPIGMQCPHTGIVKMHGHTNLDICSGLPAPNSFWVRRIHVGIAPDAAAVDVKAAREFSWAFWIGCKSYAGGPFAIDMQKRTLADLLKGKTPATRASLEFETGKGLFIPSQCSFYGDIRTARYRRTVDAEYRETLEEETRLSEDGNGLELMMVLEGVRWRAVQ